MKYKEATSCRCSKYEIGSCAKNRVMENPKQETFSFMYRFVVRMILYVRNRIIAISGKHSTAGSLSGSVVISNNST